MAVFAEPLLCTRDSCGVCPSLTPLRSHSDASQQGEIVPRFTDGETEPGDSEVGSGGPVAEGWSQDSNQICQQRMRVWLNQLLQSSESGRPGEGGLGKHWSS